MRLCSSSTTTRGMDHGWQRCYWRWRNRARAMQAAGSLQFPRDRAEIDNRRPLTRLLHDLTNHLNRPKLRVHDIETRRVAEEVEDAARGDDRLQRQPNRLEKPVELPAPAAEGADVADRAHRHLDQAL